MLKSKWNYFVCLILIGCFLGCQKKGGFEESVSELSDSPASFNYKIQYKNLGFENLGNTCFANAVFKLLSANPEFLDFLYSLNTTPSATDGAEKSAEEKKDNTTEPQTDSKAKPNPKKKKTKKRNREVTEPRAKKNTTRSLVKLFTLYKTFERLEIDHPQSENKTNYYRNQLNSFYTHFDSYLKKRYPNEDQQPYFREEQNGLIRENQQDAQEFLNEVLVEILGLNGDFYLSCRVESTDRTRPPNGGTTQIYFPFVLPILDPKVNSLSEAFEKLVEEVTLDPENAVDAEDGKEKLTQKKSKISVLNLDQIPSYFFASLSRFEYDLGNGQRKKVTKYIDSKSTIRMTIFQTVDNTAEEKPEWYDDARSITVEYEPIGFVVHSGKSASSGHYYSYIFDDHSKSWFLHDDSRVIRIDPAETDRLWNDVNKNGYLILYKEKGKAPAY